MAKYLCETCVFSKDRGGDCSITGAPTYYTVSDDSGWLPDEYVKICPLGLYIKGKSLLASLPKFR